MPHVIFAATRWGYCVQVIDGGKVVYEYSAGNCWKESQTIVAPDSPGAARLHQLKRWAKQTAGEVAKERKIPAKQVEYDADLEAQLKEIDAQR